MKTLAMLKMEKNFIAYLEKGYPRQPYECYTIVDLFVRLEEEVEELRETLKNKEIENAKLECADISNIIDYIFERLNKERVKE